MVESKVLRIYENDIPLETLINPMDNTLSYSAKLAAFEAQSFNEFILSEIKRIAIRDGISTFAVINAKELAEMIKVYDNSEYVKVVRCENCEYWKKLGVSIEDGNSTEIGYCQKSGIIRPLDYFCADGMKKLEWKEEMPSEDDN